MEHIWMRSMQLSFSQLCNPLLCSGLVSLLPRFTTIVEKAYLCVFACHSPSGQISAAFLFDPLLGLREAFGDVASFWLAGLGLGGLPWGLLAAACREASLVIVGAMTANCPDPLSLLSDPAAETTNLSYPLCYMHYTGFSATI